MTISLFLPLIKLEVSSPGVVQHSFVYVEQLLVEESIITPENKTDFSIQEEQREYSRSFSLSKIYVSIYWLGICISFLLLVQSLWNVWHLIRKGKRVIRKEGMLILTKKIHPPFNWWNYIILSETDYNEVSEEILLHEASHCRKNHSWDLLFMEIIILFHWFNPVVWLLKRELQDIHEYEADSEVLKNGIDATRYQLLLVKKAVGSSSYTLANSFNQSKLKKRITMMCKKESNTWNRWKVVLLLPVMAGSLYAFASPDTDRVMHNFVVNEVTTISSEPQEVSPEYFEDLFEKWMDGKEKDPLIFSADNTYLTSLYYTTTDKGNLGNIKHQIVPLFINSKNRIMYNGKYYKNAKMLPTLIAADLKNSALPFIVFYNTASGTSAKLKESIYQIIKDTFVENYDMEEDRAMYLLQRQPNDQYDNYWWGECFTNKPGYARVIGIVSEK